MRIARAHMRKTSNVFLAHILAGGTAKHTTAEIHSCATLQTQKITPQRPVATTDRTQLIVAIQSVALPVNADSEL